MDKRRSPHTDDTDVAPYTPRMLSESCIHGYRQMGAANANRQNLKWNSAINTKAYLPDRPECALFSGQYNNLPPSEAGYIQARVAVEKKTINDTCSTGSEFMITEETACPHSRWTAVIGEALHWAVFGGSCSQK